MRALTLTPSWLVIAFAACASACAASTGPEGPRDAAVGTRDAAIADAARPDAGSAGACSVDSDCTWTEIDHEILARADCVCLFGCPNFVVNRTTASRREAQYMMLCTPGVDGMGRPCAVDDCAGPPPAVCTNGVCQAR